MAAMPTKRVFATPIINDNNLYVIGGCDAAGIPLDAVEMFAGKKKWRRLASMPTKRAGSAVLSIGTKIIAICGVAVSQEPLDAVEIYDTVTKTWTTMEPLGEPLLGVSAVVKGKINNVEL